MSEYQVAVILSVYLIIVRVAASTSPWLILKRVVRNIERLLTDATEQNAGNKNEVSNREDENESENRTG